MDPVANQTQDSDSIERVFDIEELEDDVFLGYFAVDSDGKKRPVPAPRRLVQVSVANPDITPLEDGGRTHCLSA